jgi:hypothetical protein
LRRGNTPTRDKQKSRIATIRIYVNYKKVAVSIVFGYRKLKATRLLLMSLNEVPQSAGDFRHKWDCGNLVYGCGDLSSFM